MLGLSPAGVALAMQALSGLSFATFNIFLNEFNVWALNKDHYPHFTFPAFYSMWHMLASSCFSLLIIGCVTRAPGQKLPSWAEFWSYRYGLVPIALSTTINIECNNMSLMYISLFLNQIIKAVGPVPTMAFSYLLERKRYHWTLLVSVVGLVAGCILAVPSKSGGPSTSGGGLVLALVSLVAASLKPVVMALAMKDTPERPKLAPTSVLFYDTSLSFWLMLLWWLIYWPGARTDAATTPPPPDPVFQPRPPDPQSPTPNPNPRPTPTPNPTPNPAPGPALARPHP